MTDSIDKLTSLVNDLMLDKMNRDQTNEGWAAEPGTKRKMITIGNTGSVQRTGYSGRRLVIRISGLSIVNGSLNLIFALLRRFLQMPSRSNPLSEPTTTCSMVFRYARGKFRFVFFLLSLQSLMSVLYELTGWPRSCDGW